MDISKALACSLSVLLIVTIAGCSGDSGGTPNTDTSIGDCVIDTSSIGDCKL